MAKKLTLVHGSDFHGTLPDPTLLPVEPDLLALTGDLAGHNIDNFEFSSNGYGSGYSRRHILRGPEGEFQLTWAKEKLVPWVNVIRPKAVIVLPGNHDFWKPSLLFRYACDEGSVTYEINGVKVGLATGIMPIIGEWNDEVGDEVFKSRLHGIQNDIRLLFTHAGPHGILDHGYNDYDHFGYKSFTGAVFGRYLGAKPYFRNLRGCFYGHAHESRGEETKKLGNRKILFSNASNQVRTYTLNL